jgi:hypothetical protein
MTTPSTGALKFSDINTELGLGSTTQISMSAALTRTLAALQQIGLIPYHAMVLEGNVDPLEIYFSRPLMGAGR